MKKNWRPEDWESIKEFITYTDSFEAGADAILDSLRKKGHRVETVTTLNWDKSVISGKESGYMVFIPDEKEV